MKIVKGRVASQLFGICTNIVYDDGCVRPGDISLEVGSMVTSNAEVQDGVCEHYDVQIAQVPKPAAPVAKVPVAPVAAKPKAMPAPKVITAQDILTAREKPKRTPLPDVDPPTPPEIIELAKRPPRIKSNPATAPVRSANVPIETGFEFDITGLTPSEIAELHGGARATTESVSAVAGRPSNPFADDFDPRNPASSPKPQRRW